MSTGTRAVRFTRRGIGLVLLGLALLVSAGRAQISPSSAARAIDPGPVTDPARRVAVFVPPVLFDEPGFHQVYRLLVLEGWRPVTVGADTTIASGFEYTLVRPEAGLDELVPEAFAGLVLVGGSGAVLRWQDSTLFAAVRDFAEAGKPVAAIGLAVPILARAGVLADRDAAFFPDPEAIKLVTDHGGRFVHAPVVVEDNIITFAPPSHPDPGATRRFMTAFLAALEAQE